MRYEDNHYKIGEGTFGTVYKGYHIATARQVALKKIRIKRVKEGIPVKVLREIKSMEMLDNDNILKLHGYYVEGSAIVLATELMAADLSQVVQNLKREKRWFTLPEIYAVIQMTFSGLAALHAAGLMHRDIKPANLLISCTGTLKIADFGQACLADGHGELSREVATRWYRAPELLFGARHYSVAVDLWAGGCIFGEIFRRSPLFPGENDIDQIHRLLTVLGTPDEESWPCFCDLPDYSKINLPQVDPCSLETLIPDAPASALALLGSILVYDPLRRLKSAQVATHETLRDKSPLTTRKVLGEMATAAAAQASARKQAEQSAHADFESLFAEGSFAIEGEREIGRGKFAMEERGEVAAEGRANVLAASGSVDSQGSDGSEGGIAQSSDEVSADEDVEATGAAQHIAAIKLEGKLSSTQGGSAEGKAEK